MHSIALNDPHWFGLTWPSSSSWSSADSFRHWWQSIMSSVDTANGSLSSSSSNSIHPYTCSHLQQLKQQRNGLKLYKLVFSSLIAVCSDESRKRKVLFYFNWIVYFFLVKHTDAFFLLCPTRIFDRPKTWCVSRAVIIAFGCTLVSNAFILAVLHHVTCTITLKVTSTIWRWIWCTAPSIVLLAKIAFTI